MIALTCNDKTYICTSFTVEPGDDVAFCGPLSHTLTLYEVSHINGEEMPVTGGSVSIGLSPNPNLTITQEGQ